jgi:hypothetical protein
MKNFVKKEINNLNNNENYYGSNENINNETKIFNYLLNNKIVNQDYFDNKLKYTNVELLEEILKEIN